LQGRDGLVFHFYFKGKIASLGFDAALLHFWHFGADVDLRDSVDTLCVKGSMVNPGAMPRPLKGGIRQLLPTLSQMVDCVLFADLAAHCVCHKVQLSRFISESVSFDAICGRQNVRVRVGVFFALMNMDRNICCNPICVCDVLCEFKG